MIRNASAPYVFGPDDVYWSRRPKGQQYAEYRQAVDCLLAAGKEAIYGGTKGHGFWVDGERKPDDGETGNAAFWSVAEVMARFGQPCSAGPPTNS